MKRNLDLAAIDGDLRGLQKGWRLRSHPREPVRDAKKMKTRMPFKGTWEGHKRDEDLDVVDGDSWRMRS